jgi:hypothetical protein
MPAAMPQAPWVTRRLRPPLHGTRKCARTRNPAPPAGPPTPRAVACSGTRPPTAPGNGPPVMPVPRQGRRRRVPCARPLPRRSRRCTPCPVPARRRLAASTRRARCGALTFSTRQGTSCRRWHDTRHACADVAQACSVAWKSHSYAGCDRPVVPSRQVRRVARTLSVAFRAPARPGGRGHGHIADGVVPANITRSRLRRSDGIWRCRQESTVKPSAQPTLVRTQHLPPPAKTAH